MMADGEVVTDRNVIMLQILMKHLIHIGEAVFGTLVLGEMSYDDAFQTEEDTTDFKLMEHTVNFRHPLAHILEKEYQPFIGTIQEVIVGTCQTTHDGKIASDKDSFCLARLIERMGRNLISGESTLQQPLQKDIYGTALALGGNAVAHRTVDAHDTCRDFCTMQCRRIAEPHYPLGMVAELLQRNTAQQLNSTIATTTT